MNEVRQSTWIGSVFFWLTISFNALQIVALVVALWMAWSTSCTTLLKIACVLYTLSIGASSMCAAYHYQHPLEYDYYGQPIPPDDRHSLFVFRIKQAASFGAFLALMMALTITVVSNECIASAPALYWTVTVVILANLILSLLPFLLFTLAICCLPCLLLILRLRSPKHEGLSSEVLDGIPIFTYSDKTQAYGDIFIADDDATCSICLESYRDDPRIRILHCHHHFHQQCADQWLTIKAKCPLCAAPLPNQRNSPGQLV